MSLTKEVHRLMRTVRTRTDGQVSVVGFEPYTYYKGCTRQILTVAVEPNDGLYMGGRFIFLIQIPDGYPHSDEPTVWCQSDVYHPNIDPTAVRIDALTTNVCLNIFDRGTWKNSFGLETIVHGLVFLMHNPYFDDPVSPFFGAENVEQERDNVKKFMTWQEIDGRVFKLEYSLSNEEIEDKTKKWLVVEYRSTKETADYETVDEDGTCGCVRMVALDGELVLIANDRAEPPYNLVHTNKMPSDKPVTRWLVLAYSLCKSLLESR